MPPWLSRCASTTSSPIRAAVKAPMPTIRPPSALRSGRQVSGAYGQAIASTSSSRTAFHPLMLPIMALAEADCLEAVHTPRTLHAEPLERGVDRPGGLARAPEEPARCLRALVVMALQRPESEPPVGPAACGLIADAAEEVSGDVDHRRALRQRLGVARHGLGEVHERVGD